jgi:enoyl-CoA hydratase
MSDLVEPQKVDITYETDEPVRYEVADGVAWITMNRPQFHNAQNGQMTYALDDAFNRAVQDDAVRAIVLAGEGKHFSAGHDIGTPGRDLHKEFDNRLLIPGHTNKPAAELLYTREAEQYVGMCKRWREAPKPTVAMVQGACIAGGLMLAWICDLIIASEDAFFQDPVVRMGIPGVEYFAHACRRASPRNSCFWANACPQPAPIHSAWSTRSCRAMSCAPKSRPLRPSSPPSRGLATG